MENAALLRPRRVTVLSGYFSLRAVILSGFIGLTTALAIRGLLAVPPEPERPRMTRQAVDQAGRPVGPPIIEEPVEKPAETDKIRVAGGKVVSVTGEFEDVIWLWAFGSATVFLYSFLAVGLWRGLGWCRVILVVGAPIVDFFTLIVLSAIEVEYWRVNAAGSAVLALTVYVIAIAVLWTERASGWFMSMRALRKDRESIRTAAPAHIVAGSLLVVLWAGLSTLSLFSAIYRANLLGGTVLGAASAIAILVGLLLAIPPEATHPTGI